MTVLDAIIRDDSDRIVVLYFSGAPQKLMHLWMPTLFMVAYKTMEL